MASDRDELAKQLLEDQLSDGDLVLHWMLVARVETPNDTTVALVTANDRCDMITALGLAEALKMEAADQYHGLTPIDMQDDEDDEIEG